MDTAGALAVLLCAVFGLVVGGLSGFWVGARGQERAKGHPLLIAILAVLALAALGLYTLGGSSDELFARLVMVPLSILVAIASVGALVGIPMYASYALGHRGGRWAMRDRGASDDP